MLETVTLRKGWGDKDNRARQRRFGGGAPVSGLKYEKSERLLPGVGASLDLPMVLYMAHYGAGRHES